MNDRFFFFIGLPLGGLPAAVCDSLCFAELSDCSDSPAVCTEWKKLNFGIVLSEESKLVTVGTLFFALIGYFLGDDNLGLPRKPGDEEAADKMLLMLDSELCRFLLLTALLLSDAASSVPGICLSSDTTLLSCDVTRCKSLASLSSTAEFISKVFSDWWIFWCEVGSVSR